MCPWKDHIKKASALFFFCILIFIHAEKALHSHPPELRAKSSHSALIKHFSATCSICEFQVTKDASMPAVLYPGQAQVIEEPEFSFFQVYPQTQYFQSIPGRGPPALL
jgi:hypothetical protein